LSNSLEQLTTLPTLSFEGELVRLLAQPRTQRPADYVKQLASADLAEVREVLAG
jgi:hypothetical protein